MEICYIFFGIVGFALLLFTVLELHYFLRTMMSVVWARISKKKVNILDETRVTGFCLMTDIDYLLNHMNNARYIRELDFAKMDFYERTGLYQAIKKSGGSMVMGATTIRYRKFIKLFHKFYITTKIIYWDSQSVYMEHRFITPSDNFINAIVMCKTRAINCNLEEIIANMLNVADGDVENTKKCKPEKSLELEKWIESNEISSQTLRSAIN